MRFGLSSDSTALRIMALQVGARRDCLHIQIPGRFAQKGRRDSESVSRMISQRAEQAAERFGWQPVPRARVAIEMRFFARHGNIPDLHHLVKFYLDPLCGVAFMDDTQVGCLVATSWKLPREFSEKEHERENSVFIKVKRFAECVRRFDLCQALRDDSDFRCEIGETEDDGSRFGDRDGLILDEHWFDVLDFDEDTRTAWRRLNLMEVQKGLLAGTRIDWRDRPGGAPGRLARVGFLWKRQAHPLLFAVDLRGLPRRGESAEFRTHVRAQLRAVGERWGDRGRFVMPVELDVQVPDESGATATDLDNVMRRYIAPALTDELLKAPDGYLHGYRIYRVKPAAAEDRAISVKIMTEGAIQRFEEWTDKTLEAGREWLRDSLRRY